MIVKMKFLSISGPKTDIDRVCDQYLSKYEMQLENAVAELKTTDNLQPFVDLNPYREPLAKAEQFTAMIKDDKICPKAVTSQEEMLAMIREVNHDFLELQEQKELLKKKVESLRERLDVLTPFQPLDLDLYKVMRYRYMKVRFGRISVDYFNRLEKYLFDDLNAVFIEGARDENYVFNSLHFERISLSSDFIGTPTQACEELQKEIGKTKKKIKKIKQSIRVLVEKHAAELLGAQKRLEELCNIFDVRKMAARIEEGDNKEEYYILCGWMGEEDVAKFLEETKKDDKIFVVVEEDREKFFGEPPTKLKNPKLFKPFEMFVRMYGLPANDEMDPTMFVALTYTFIFGAMFGDVGQGFCLFAIGGILYLTKKINLAGIISVAGIFSMAFGFMFGSVFGFEDVIPALWLKPVEAMTNLPFIGQLNTVFIVAVAFGMGLNLLVILFQMINAIKAHDRGNLLFSNNGLAGFVFYGCIILTIVLYMTGHKTPSNILLAICLGIPVILFVFKEPLTNLVEHNHKKLEEGKVMFFVQGFFELFETMLSYFSNTLSYVRIGAFAVSHAAIMEVVLMLSGAESGSVNIFGVILGNVIVCLLEGLIVGIQVLRLEYYEMFSRFYKGTGREFKPFDQHKKEH